MSELHFLILLRRSRDAVGIGLPYWLRHASITSADYYCSIRIAATQTCCCSWGCESSVRSHPRVLVAHPSRARRSALLSHINHTPIDRGLERGGWHPRLIVRQARSPAHVAKAPARGLAHGRGLPHGRQFFSPPARDHGKNAPGKRHGASGKGPESRHVRHSHPPADERRDGRLKEEEEGDEEGVHVGQAQIENRVPAHTGPHGEVDAGERPRGARPAEGARRRHRCLL
mmetsp:Transcript_21963/g.68352  ORF Transcript_21963/g.68352 Transcript_21963/m.68352 type:complete len:229 (+) Transcript_21963:247-933(+)